MIILEHPYELNICMFYLCLLLYEVPNAQLGAQLLLLRMLDQKHRPDLKWHDRYL